MHYSILYLYLQTSPIGRHILWWQWWWICCVRDRLAIWKVGKDGWYFGQFIWLLSAWGSVTDLIGQLLDCQVSVVLAAESALEWPTAVVYLDKLCLSYGLPTQCAATSTWWVGDNVYYYGRLRAAWLKWHSGKIKQHTSRETKHSF